MDSGRAIDGTDVGERLNELLRASGQEPLGSDAAEQFAEYLSLILRWNARTNLTAIRDEEGILSRHFVESIACARALPAGIGTLLDLGSGAGFPGIPIALCRPEIAVMLAESQGKKAAFLREAVRALGLRVTVHGDRAETLQLRFDCVALRAVDRMEGAVRIAAQLIGEPGWLAVMTTQSQFAVVRSSAGAGFSWREPVRLPQTASGIIALGQRTG